METLVYICIACLVTLTVLWAGHHEWVSRRRRRSSPLPPGPFPLPILGNLPQLMIAGAAQHRYFASLAKKYGPIFCIQLGSKPVIVVSSSSLARAILHTHDKTFAGRPPLPNMRLLVGDKYGDKMLAFLPYGNEWQETRKLYIHHLFSPRRIEEFHSGIISHEIHRLIHTRLIPATNSGDAIDLTACTQNLVEDIICRAVMSRRPESFINESTTKAMARASFTQGLHEFERLVGAPLISEFSPFLRLLDYNTKACMKKWKCWFDDFMERIINEREKDPLCNEECSQDMLGILMSPENKLSRGLIKTLLMELFFAGIESTSTAIDWVMCEVLSNPRVIGKLREELQTVVGRREGDVVEVSDIPQLPYLRAVVKETLRVHPPAPLMIPRMSLHACEDVAGYGYVIPKGTRVILNVWAIARDPNVWMDDPDSFVPERFLEDAYSSLDVKGKHFEVLPFGSGRRMCPGMNLALPIVEMTLANLVQAFDDWKVVLPLGQNSLDTSDKCIVSCRRAHPLLVVPIKKATIA